MQTGKPIVGDSYRRKSQMVSLVVRIIRFFPDGRSHARRFVAAINAATLVGEAEVTHDIFGMQEISCSIRGRGDIMEYKNWPRAVFVGRCGGGGGGSRLNDSI